MAVRSIRSHPCEGTPPSPAHFSRWHGMPARCGMWASLPRAVPEACPPHRECQRPSAWRAFLLACGLPELDCVERILEAQATVPARLMEPRNVLPKLRHGVRLPDREISGQEMAGFYLIPASLPTIRPEAAPDDKPAPRAPRAIPEASIVRSTGYAPTGSSGRQEASSPNNAPPPAPHRVMQPCERPSPPASLPSGRRRASASRRVATAWNQAISRHRLPFLHACPSARPYGPAGQPPDKDGDCRPDLKKVFLGWGEQERGRDSFYKKRPAPLVPPAPAPHCAPRVVGRACRPPSERAPETPRAGTVSCPRSPVPAKDGGQFLSALCLRLWPCCMK